MKQVIFEFKTEEVYNHFVKEIVTTVRSAISKDKDMASITEDINFIKITVNKMLK